MKRLASTLLLALAIAVPACATDDIDTSSSLTIDNDSTFTFIEINLSPTDRVSWGPDLLGAEVLTPGETFLATGIACDTYDIRVVDEDNDECILDTVNLCLDNAVWQIDNAELASCAAF
jgi:hypothetical protein